MSAEGKTTSETTCICERGTNEAAMADCVCSAKDPTSKNYTM